MAVSAAIRTAAATFAVCVGLYTVLLLGAAKLTAQSAAGSLLARNGVFVGSRQVAQKFEAPHYLWPRPSAADYNGSAASGSNKSPTNPELRSRAEAIVARYGATAANPLPAELATMSGAGLDPHVSLGAALYQAPRVARARSIPEAEVRRLIEAGAADVPFAGEAGLVNVLETNLALDAAYPLKSRSD